MNTPAECPNGKPAECPNGKPALSVVADELAVRLDGLAEVERDVPIARFTTYRLGGPAAVLVRVGSLPVLTDVVEVVAEHDAPLLVIGKGSNLLVADRGFAGLAITLEGDFAAVTIDAAQHRVTAGAAVPLQSLARTSASAGQHGLEFFVGIPGSVGGAVRMNAGGHGRETADVLVRATVLRVAPGARPETRAVAALGMGYRASNLDPRDIVLGAELAVTDAPAAECEALIAEIVHWRKEHQPGGSNGGSVFRNPPGDSAGRLIDELGLKGLQVGGATVSPKHANFFQAGPGATADDVYRLILEVRSRVFAATGVELVPEVRLLGFEAPTIDEGAP